DVEGELAFRRSVDGELATPADLLDLLGERLGVADVARRKAKRLERRRRPVLDGQISQLRALNGVDMSTEVERRPSVLAKVEDEGDAIALAFHGKRLLLPSRLWPEADFVVDADLPFTPADLPGDLDDAGRAVLVRRLVREGFLRIRLPAAPAGR
ncbi:MAG TPA: hypothetical protein VKA45_03965, partial [Gaiellaceae bacterium]|nr:hypothetical protein [Gaiellaceae bacterium]